MKRQIRLAVSILFFAGALGGCHKSIIITPATATAPAYRGIVYGASGKKYIKSNLAQAFKACVTAEKHCRLQYVKPKG